MKFITRIYTLFLFIVVFHSFTAESAMKKPTSKIILTPGRTKQTPKISSTRDNKPNEILPASNKIIPVNKKSGNIVLKMAKLSTKAAVTALKLTKGTLKSSVDLLAGNHPSRDADIWLKL